MGRLFARSKFPKNRTRRGFRRLLKYSRGQSGPCNPGLHAKNRLLISGIGQTLGYLHRASQSSQTRSDIKTHSKLTQCIIANSLNVHNATVKVFGVGAAGKRLDGGDYAVMERLADESQRRRCKENGKKV